MSHNFPPGLIVVFGGRSEIGLALAKLMCHDRGVVLAARDQRDFFTHQQQLLECGARDVVFVSFTADAQGNYEQILAGISASEQIGIVIMAFGILGDANKSKTDYLEAKTIGITNYIAHVELLTTLKNTLTPPALIINFSSIAGTRVRKANYVYGSTKAGLDGFLQGYTDDLHGSGLKVLTVRPGFVIGAMTKPLLDQGIKPAPLSVTAPDVATATIKAIRRGKNTVWVPWTLRYVALALHLIPRNIWRRIQR